MTLVVAALAVTVAILAVLVVGLLRSHAAILRRLHELGYGLEGDHVPARAPGTAAPTEPGPRASSTEAPADVVGRTPAGGDVAVRISEVDHDTLLVFLSSTCTTCAAFWDRLRRPVDLPADVRLVIVTQGAEHESPSALQGLAPEDITLVMSDQAWRDHAVPGSPYVVLVNGPTGARIGEGTGPNWDQVARNLAEASGDRGFIGERSRRAAGDRDRGRAVDAELLAAGLRPGDDRLYGDSSEDPS